MRVYLFILTTLLLCFSAVKSQNALNRYLQENEGKDILSKHMLKLAPLNLLDPQTPTLEIGYEILLNTAFSAQLSVGWITKNISGKLIKDFNETDHSTDGFRVRLEAKQYIKHKFKLKQYLAIDLGHIYQEDKNREFIFADCKYCDDPNTTATYKDTINLIRNNTLVNFKYGVLRNWGKHWFWEAYVGLGVKYRRVRHKKRRNINNFIAEYDSFFNVDRRNYRGNTFMLSIPMNIKLGYRIN